MPIGGKAANPPPRKLIEGLLKGNYHRYILPRCQFLPSSLTRTSLPKLFLLALPAFLSPDLLILQAQITQSHLIAQVQNE